MKKKQNTSLIFLAHQAIVEISYHNCYQLIISLKNTFSTTINNIQKPDLKGLLINRGIEHTCDVIDASVIVYYIESDSSHGRLLDDLMKDKPFIELDDFFNPQELSDIYLLGNQTKSLSSINKFANDTLNKMLPVLDLPPKIDPRIKKIMNYIDDNINKNITLPELSSIAFLSPERLRHLFTEQTGTSFSQYIIWKRINNIITEVTVKGSSMAEAASKYGFTDQSHFSKLFKRMFGVTAKTMLLPSPFIQFLDLDTREIKHKSIDEVI